MSSHILNVYEHYTAVLLCMKHKSFVKFSVNLAYPVVSLHIFLFYDHLYKDFPQYIN
jgi:hypothetical protein